MISFLNTDNHTPDMITWMLKTQPEYESTVKFAETKKAGLGEDKEVEMEIHLKRLCDVAELVAKAATQAAQSMGRLREEFMRKTELATTI